MPGALPPVIATFLADVTKYKASVTEAIGSNEKLGASADATQAKSSGAFTKMSGVGKVALLGIAAGAVAIGAKSISAAKDYQELTTQLVTGAGESASNLKLVSNGLLTMAPQVGMGPGALAKAMFTVESAGYHGAAGLNVMKAAAEGAKIGGADATVVANGLTTALSDYHLKASDAATITSQLVTTVGQGKTTMGDLSGSLSAVLPSAAAAGIGLQQVLGAMATMTGEGISAQQSSQDLAGTIRSLQNPTQEQTKAMEALGLNSLTVAQNLGKQGLTGTLGSLVSTITAHMGPAGTVIESTFKKSEAAAADASTELKAMPASIQGIAKQFQSGTITSTTWRAALKGMTVDQKAMAQQFATTVQGGKGFNDLLKSGGPSAQTFAATLSKVTGGSTGMNTALALTGGNMATFQNNVKAVSGATAEAGGHVKGWSETSKDLNVQIAQAKAYVDALFIKIGTALIPILEKVIKVGTQWTLWLTKHKTVLMILVGIVGGILAAVIAAYIVSMITAAAATIAATWPILAIIAGIALLVIGVLELVKHWSAIWGEIKKIASDAWNWIKGIFDDVVAFAKKWGPLILLAIAPMIAIPLLILQHWKTISTFFSKIGSDIEGWFTGAISWLKQAGINIVTGAWNGIKAAWVAVSTFFGKVGTTFKNWFTGSINWLKQIGTDIITGLWTGIKAEWNLQVGVYERVGTTIKNWFTGAIGWLTSAGDDIMTGLFSELATIWGNEVRNWSNIGDKVKAWFSGADTWLIDTGEAIIHGLVQGIENVGGDVAGALKNIISKVPGASMLSHVPGLSSLGLATGGYVPGQKGQVAPGVYVHAGEFVLSTAMVAGQVAPPPEIRAAVIASGGGPSGLSSPAVGPAVASPAAAGGTYVTHVTVQGSVVDTKGFFKAMQDAGIDQTRRNGPNGLNLTYSRGGS